MDNVGTFYGHLEYITAIWNILGPFSNQWKVGTVFPVFGTLHQEKSGNPAPDHKAADPTKNHR
jgi:hypothetical protein